MSKARRMHWAIRLAIAVASVIAVAAPARAEAPALVPIQGFLTDAAGTPIDGPTEMTFSLYTTAAGTTPIYRETQSVMVEDGYFTAYIGDVTPLGLAVFRDQGMLYVGVRVGDDPELLPRALLGSVPFAGFAQYAGEMPFARLTDVPAGLSDGDDDTRYGAGPGLVLMGTTFSVDTTTIQARVSGTCPAGQSIREIRADGTVTCEVDDSYTDAQAIAAMRGLCSRVRTATPRPYTTLNAQLDADPSGASVCGSGYHVCNYQEMTVYSILGLCDLGTTTWIVGGFSNVDFHRRSIWNGQDSVQCSPGNYPAWWNRWGPYYGRVHCEGGGNLYPVACCQNM